MSLAKASLWTAASTLVKIGAGLLVGKLLAGLALGMKENKTIILQFGELRIFSDILGKHVTKYRGKDKENDFKLDLLEKLKIAGCQCEAGRDYYNIKIDY